MYFGMFGLGYVMSQLISKPYQKMYRMHPREMQRELVNLSGDKTLLIIWCHKIN